MNLILPSKKRSSIVAIVITILLLMLVAPSNASQAIIVGGDCTLADAIRAANRKERVGGCRKPDRNLR